MQNCLEKSTKADNRETTLASLIMGQEGKQTMRRKHNRRRDAEAFRGGKWVDEAKPRVFRANQAGHAGAGAPSIEVHSPSRPGQGAK